MAKKVRGKILVPLGVLAVLLVSFAAVANISSGLIHGKNPASPVVTPNRETSVGFESTRTPSVTHSPNPPAGHFSSPRVPQVAGPPIHSAPDPNFKTQQNPAKPASGAMASTAGSSPSLVGGGGNDGVCGAPAPCNNLIYNGGPIMHNPTFLLIFWAGCGSNGCLSCSTGFFDNPQSDPNAANPNDCTYAGLILRYFQDFCNDPPMLALVNQYTDSAGNMGSCSVYGNNWYYDFNPFPSNPLSDAQIQAEAHADMAALGGAIAIGGTSYETFMFTPIGEGSPNFPSPFCAYHNNFVSISPPNLVIYASVPDDAAKNVCITTGPNSDPFADAVITETSHEQIESITDPTGGGWFYQDTAHEIGDECNRDFAGLNLQVDKSNVHLGTLPFGDPYTIQTEWSNANNGCTLDLLGPPTQVQFTLTPDQNQIANASPPPGGFPIEFQEAGETAPATATYNFCCATTNTFFVTPGTVDVRVDPVSATNGIFCRPANQCSEQWCFSWNAATASCESLFETTTGQTAYSYYYYDLQAQDPYLCFNPPAGSSANCNNSVAGSPPEIDLTYATAPDPATIFSGEGDLAYQTTSVPLVTTSQRIFTASGSLASVPACAPLSFSGGFQFCGTSNGERWDAGEPCLTLSPYTCSATYFAYGIDFIQTIPFWHQFAFTGSYLISGGGSPTAPTLSSTQYGPSFTTPLTNTETAYWLDAGASWSIDNPLQGSGLAERWQTSDSVSGVMTAAVTESPTYYHQYFVNFMYSVVGGAIPFSPPVTYTAFGASGSVIPSGSVWLDSGSSYSYTNPVVDFVHYRDARWASAGAVSGTISSSTTVDPAYYEQFGFLASYSVSDGGSPTAPTLSSDQFGGAYNTPLTTSPTLYWLDTGASWNLSPNPLGGSTPTERWVTSLSPLSGTIPAELGVSPVYFHQFFVPVSYFVSDGSIAPSSPTLTDKYLGTTISQTLLTTPASLWLDADGWSATSVLTGSTSTERWFAPINSGVVTAAPIAVEYFHQYFVTFAVALCCGTTSPTSSWQNAGSTITITALPASGYKFAAWMSNTSKIRIADAGSSTTTATINGSGTIKVRFHP